MMGIEQYVSGTNIHEKIECVSVVILVEAASKWWWDCCSVDGLLNCCCPPLKKASYMPFAASGPFHYVTSLYSFCLAKKKK